MKKLRQLSSVYSSLVNLIRGLVVARSVGGINHKVLAPSGFNSQVIVDPLVITSGLFATIGYIDAQSRALIRYALETNDPWLPELMRRADAGETIVYTVNSLKHPHPATK